MTGYCMRCGIPHTTPCKRPITDTVDAGMSNNGGLSDIRDRIAAAIYGAASQWDDYPWQDLAEHVQAAYRGQADAVIAELNIAKACESGCVWQIPRHYKDMTDAQKKLLKMDDG